MRDLLISVIRCPETPSTRRASLRQASKQNIWNTDNCNIVFVAFPLRPRHDMAQKGLQLKLWEKMLRGAFNWFSLFGPPSIIVCSTAVLPPVVWCDSSISSHSAGSRCWMQRSGASESPVVARYVCGRRPTSTGLKTGAKCSPVGRDKIVLVTG